MANLAVEVPPLSSHQPRDRPLPEPRASLLVRSRLRCEQHRIGQQVQLCLRPPSSATLPTLRAAMAFSEDDVPLPEYWKQQAVTGVVTGVSSRLLGFTVLSVRSCILFPRLAPRSAVFLESCSANRLLLGPLPGVVNRCFVRRFVSTSSWSSAVLSSGNIFCILSSASPSSGKERGEP